jgi:hypothetical protein
MAACSRPGWNPQLTADITHGPGRVAGPEGLGFRALLRSRCRTAVFPGLTWSPAPAGKTEQDQEAAASVPATRYLLSTAAMKPSGSTRPMVSELTFSLRNSALACRGV